MEDALVHQDRREFRKTEGGVLILVLMEDALVHDNTFKVLKNNNVLILVLMEDALVQKFGSKKRKP